MVIEYAFISGAAILGILSIGAGFVTDKISLIVIRALSGIGTYFVPCSWTPVAHASSLRSSRFSDHSFCTDALGQFVP